MASENRELARGAIGDLRALIDLFADDIEWDNTKPNVPPDHMGIHRGKESVVSLIESWVGAWDDYGLEVDELIDAGEHVVLAVHESGRGKASGVPMESTYCLVWTFRDGRIVRGSTFPSTADALAQLGGER